MCFQSYLVREYPLLLRDLVVFFSLAFARELCFPCYVLEGDSRQFLFWRFAILVLVYAVKYLVSWKRVFWRLLLYFLIFNPLDPLRTNGRLLSIHVGPVDIQKGQWTYQTKRNIFVKIGLIQTSVLVFWGFLCTIPGVQKIPVCWTSLRCPFDDYSQIANM